MKTRVFKFTSGYVLMSKNGAIKSNSAEIVVILPVGINPVGK